jgi:HK97 family phage portal protein
MRNPFKRGNKSHDDVIREKSDGTLQIKSSALGDFSNYVLSQLSGGLNGNYFTNQEAYWMFEKTAVVKDAIERIALPFSDIMPALQDVETGEYLTKPSDHPLLELLNNPSFNFDSTKLKYSLMVSYLIAGAGYPVANGNVNFEPTQLESIMANKVTLQPGRIDELERIQFTSTNQNIYNRQEIPKRKTVVFQTQSQLSETIQICLIHKSSGIQPLSPLESVYYQALMKYYGDKHNFGLVKNAARPGGLWSSIEKEGMSQEQHEALKLEVQKFVQNPGKDVVSPAPVKYENFLLKPTDMDFVNLINSSKPDIYNLYDIPLALTNVDAMTQSNYENSMISLYDNGVCPRASYVFNRLGEFLLPRYKDGDKYILTYDKKSIDALKVRMFKQAEALRKIGSFTEDEIRTTAGYEVLEDKEKGETIYRPANLVSGEEPDDMGGEGLGNDGDL